MFIVWLIFSVFLNFYYRVIYFFDFSKHSRRNNTHSPGALASTSSAGIVFAIDKTRIILRNLSQKYCRKKSHFPSIFQNITGKTQNKIHAVEFPQAYSPPPPSKKKPTTTKQNKKGLFRKQNIVIVVCRRGQGLLF